MIDVTQDLLPKSSDGKPRVYQPVLLESGESRHGAAQTTVAQRGSISWAVAWTHSGWTKAECEGPKRL